MLFTLETCHATSVGACQKTGLISHNLAPREFTSDLYVYIPNSAGSRSFLFSGDNRFIRFSGEEKSVSLMGFAVYRRSRNKTGDLRVNLFRTATSQFLCAEPSYDVGNLWVNRPSAGEWELFTLRPAEVYSPIVLMNMSIADMLLPLSLNAKSAHLFLRSDINFSLLNAVQFQECPEQFLRMLSTDELKTLARLLTSDVAAVNVLSILLRDDVWISSGLKNLVGFLNKHSLSKDFVTTVDQSFDNDYTSGLDGNFSSSGHLLNSLARRIVVTEKETCIVAVARNEGMYLLEWVAYHRKLGFENIFIYSSENNDGSDDLLDALAKEGLIFWIKNHCGESINMQIKSYAHALQINPFLTAFRWAAFIDIDEYVVIDSELYSDIYEFLAEKDAAGSDAVALSWLVFGTSRKSRFEFRPVTQRFQIRENNVNPHIKSIFRPHKFIHSKAHYPVQDNISVRRFVNAIDLPHNEIETGNLSFSSNPVDKGAWINHYHFKSLEEYVLRRSYGRSFERFTDINVDSLSSDWFEWLINYQKVDGTFDNRLTKCCPNLASDIAALRAIPRVCVAADKVDMMHSRRRNRLEGIIAAMPRFHQKDLPENTWLNLVMGQPDE